MFKIILCIIFIAISGILYCCLRVASKCERELESMQEQNPISNHCSEHIVEDIVELEQTAFKD